MRLLFLVLLVTLLLAAASIGEVRAQAAEPCGETYQIKRGDWLSKIANRCGVTLKELIEANPEIRNPERIYVGQVIHIAGEPEPALYTGSDTALSGGQISLDLRGFPPEIEVELGLGRVGEDLISMGKAETDERGRLSTKVSVPESAGDGESWIAGAIALNRSQTVALTEPFQISGEVLTYTIKRGDRLSVLAYNHKTSVAALLDVNPDIENPHRIFVGQKIVVPPEGYVPSSESIARARNAPVPPRAGASIPGGLKPGERWIGVNLSTQTVHAYEGETLVRSFIASTGRPATPTVTGQYRIYVKFTKTDMRGPGYHYRDVPYTMYFYRGYGLHGTFWHNNFGTPMSAGCVNLSTPDAEWLFNFASVGTLVNVHH
jgi:lipoprotein-anchoring transpeptidase ErfK/SrfK